MKRFAPWLLLCLVGCSSDNSTITPLVRLFYLGSGSGKILSATSTDGITFTEEAGTRFEKTSISHPDLFQVTAGQLVLFVTQENRLFKTTASSQTDSFTEESSFDWNSGGHSSTHSITTTLTDESTTTTVITTFHCADGIIQRASYSSSTGNLSGQARALTNAHGSGVICDPTVIRKGDGSYLMFYRWAPSATSTEASEHQIYAASSTDGLSYTAGISSTGGAQALQAVATGVVQDKASSPSAVKINSQKVFLYAEDGTGSSSSGVVVGTSSDGGETFSFQPVVINNLSTAKAQNPHGIKVSGTDGTTEEIIP